MKNEHIYNILLEIKEDMGHVKAKVGGIHFHVRKQNGRIKNLEDKSSKADVVFGKIGLVVAGAIIVFSVLGKELFTFFKDILTKP